MKCRESVKCLKLSLNQDRSCSSQQQLLYTICIFILGQTLFSCHTKSAGCIISVAVLFSVLPFVRVLLSGTLTHSPSECCVGTEEERGWYEEVQNAKVCHLILQPTGVMTIAWANVYSIITCYSTKQSVSSVLLGKKCCASFMNGALSQICDEMVCTNLGFINMFLHKCYINFRTS